MVFILPWNQKDLRKIWNWRRDMGIYFDIFGWWADNHSTSSYYLLLKAVQYVFLGLNLSFFVSVTFGVVQSMMRTSNMIDNLFSFFAATPGYLGLCKILCIVANRSKIMHVWATLDEMLDESVKYKMDEKLLVELRGRFKRCLIINYVLLVIGMSINIHWGCRPLISAAFGEKMVILDTWPNYIDTWLLWFLTYLFQASNIFSLGHGLHMYDNLYFCTCEQILVHFTILKHHLHGLDLSKENPGEVNLKFCTNYHKKLIDTCIEWRDATATAILLQIIMSVVIMCPGVFELVSGRHTELATVINLLEIVLNVGTVLYLYCWYSNEVTYEAGSVYRACYFTDWEKGSISQRKPLGIMMARSMKPLVFGGIVKIDLESYITVWKTIFSYYQFLDNVNKSAKET